MQQSGRRLMQAELVITGFGAVGSFGGSCGELCAAIAKGRQLAWPSSRLGREVFSAEIESFDLGRHRNTANGHRAPRLSQYALAAAAQAIAAARLEDRRCNRDEVAVVYGTGNGPAEVVARNLEAITSVGLDAVEPLAFQESVFNAPGSRISIEYGFRGPLLALPMGWAAGAYALAAAAELIAFGHAEVVLVVASDEVTPLTHDAMCALGLARGGAAGCSVAGRSRGRRARVPVLPSEGGAAVVIETRAHAHRREVEPALELAGWGVCSDAFGVGPKGKGQAALGPAMRAALARGDECQVAQVYAGSYCSADADQAEAAALAQVFGGTGCPPVANLRHVIGETKAPSALFNLIAAENLLRQQAQSAAAAVGAGARVANAALCNAFWVNGTNASLLVRRPS